MGRKKTACETCASIKALCSKGIPCARCIRLSLPCNLGGNATIAPGKKTEYTRSKNGCTNCRLRHKKCDENRPVCGDCQRLQLDCTAIERRSRGISSNTSTARVRTPASSQNSTVTSTSGSNTRRRSGIDTFEIMHEDRTRATYSNWLSLITDESMNGLSANRNLANSSALVDVPMPSNLHDEVAMAMYHPPTALSNLTGVEPQVMKDWTIGERHLLFHFLQSVSRALVVVDDKENPFLRVIVPMALESPMVRHALLALSASHLSKVYPAFAADITTHRPAALQQLKLEINESDICVWALATTLLLCLAEICDGNSTKWLLHLHGARALLSETDDAIIKPPFSFLAELYNYLTCIASVTSNQVPRKFGSQLQVHSEIDSHAPSPLLGKSIDLYELLVRVNNLADRRYEVSTTTTSEEFGVEAQEIQLALQSWTPAEEDEQGCQHEAQARAAAFALQWAIIIRLKQLTRSSQPQNVDFQIKKASDNVISALSLIKPGSQMEAHTLFSLFMAGLGNTTKAGRLTVEYRLNVMETTFGFGNVLSAHKLLDEIWHLSNQSFEADWEILLRGKYPGLILF